MWKPPLLVIIEQTFSQNWAETDRNELKISLEQATINSFQLKLNSPFLMDFFYVFWTKGVFFLFQIQSVIFYVKVHNKSNTCILWIDINKNSSNKKNPSISWSVFQKDVIAWDFSEERAFSYNNNIDRERHKIFVLNLQMVCWFRKWS